MKCLTLFLIMLIGPGCSQAVPSIRPLEHVPAMDVEKMEGDWYVIARIPTLLDRSVDLEQMHFHKTSASTWDLTWSIYKRKSSIKALNNSANKDLPLTAPTDWHFSLKSGGGKNTSQWELSPIWPMAFKFYAVELSGDSSWIVFASKDRRYMWILSRIKNLDQMILKGILDHLVKNDFDDSVITQQ